LLLQRTIIIILALTLSLGSPGQATPASAAAPEGQKSKSIVTIYLELQMPKQPVCAKKDHYVLVRTIADTDIAVNKKGNVEHVSAEPKSGVTVTSSTTNPDIGTLSPAKLVSGADPFDNPGEAVFTFHAKKAGTTILQFTPTYAGKKRKMAEIGIQVVDCAYKATMNYLMRQSSGGTSGLVIGQMDALLEGDGETYQGTGTLASDRTHTVPGCNLSFSGFENPATITGKATGSPDSDQLELTIAYEAAPSSLTATCPIVGTITSNTTEDPTNWLATNATFSGTGGSQSFPINFAQWFGRLIITVEPVEGTS
jgi:hypothetical protein